MIKHATLFALLVLLPVLAVQAAQEEPTGNSTSITKKLYTYAGPLLPSDWSLVSILNDRAVIGFNNGSARNAHMDELEPKDRQFLLRLQNGTIYSTPLSSAKEKIAQWSSSATSTVTKLGKSVKEQLDNFFNKSKDPTTNATIVLVN